MSFISSYWDSLLVYDENPRIYVISMHFMSIVSVVFFCFGTYCVVKKKKAVTPVYRKLLILYMTINILSQLCWTSFYIPHMILPYTAGNTLGFFRHLGVPPELQLTFQFTLLGGLGGATSLLFAYRYFVILPSGHWLTKRWLYTSYLVALFIFSAVIPPPLVAWTCYSSPAAEIKEHLIQKFGFITNQLYDNQTLAFEMQLGSPMFITVCYFVVCIFFLAWCIAWIIRGISVALNGYSNQLTNYTKKQHRSLTKMLYVQTAVSFGLISLPFTAFAIFMWFGIPACGILHICFVVYSFADPSSTIIMIYMHTPYRHALLDLLVRIGAVKAQTSIPVTSTVQPVTLTNHQTARTRPYVHYLKTEHSSSRGH